MRILPVVLMLAAALPAPGPVGIVAPPIQAPPASAPPATAPPAGDALPSAVAAAFSSVVSVRVREVVRVPVFRNGRFRNEPVEGLGAGSGVVIGADGVIVTNAHVVAGAGDVRIRRSDGREVEARVMSIDEASDLALLRAPAEGLRPLTLAEDAPPKEGARVFVLGNRGDTGTEVAWARIGAHRHLRVGARPLEFWSEVEAPIGPGDSGGALLDEAGRLIGIPSLLVSYTGDRPGAVTHASGLFIPASHLRRAVARMMKEPRPTWPWVGLLLEDPLLAASQGRPWLDETARVRRVFPGSPADEAGFRRGDRIVAVNDRPVPDAFEALGAVLDLEPLRPASFDVDRDGARVRLAVKPSPRPSDPRPDPLDDFALHTGVRLEFPADPRDGRGGLAFAGMTQRTLYSMTAFEADLFRQGPALTALIPGADAMAGDPKQVRIGSPADLERLLPRCFVQEQFVATLHWIFGGRQSLDRAQVHRKIYPVVI